jgi:hypothetical protein
MYLVVYATRDELRERRLPTKIETFFVVLLGIYLHMD